VSYHYALFGNRYNYYERFDPTLGQLLDVRVHDEGSASNGYVRFSNTTDLEQTFNGTVTFGFGTIGGSGTATNLFTATLAPGSSVDEGVDTAYEFTTSYGPTSYWLGTGTLAPIVSIGVPRGTSDNPDISIGSYVYPQFVVEGIATITYEYAATPEPSSFVIVVSTCAFLAFRRVWRT
jgi:hypothetical protein